MLAPFPNMTFDQGRNRLSIRMNQIGKQKKGTYRVSQVLVRLGASRFHCDQGDSI